MILSLEEKLSTGGSNRFKSEGERKIASFLDSNAIRYHYEQGVLVTSTDKKQRIWYPDFYLPEFGSYIEYFGLAGHADYDSGIKVKESTYAAMGLPVIALYPWTFADDWQGYIMKELQRTAFQRYRDIMAKPYWSNRGKTMQRYGKVHNYPSRRIRCY